jgi:methylmalonyl-CoA mutase C-terminal domain/subunit
VVRLLRERGAADIVVFGGGVIPAKDIPKLQAEGVEEIFTPGASTQDIAAWLRRRLEGAGAA